MKVRDTSGREVHQEEINMGSHKIINVTDCATDQDAATKKYVDDNAGLWEIDGTETQLKTADEIDMQSKKIINVTDPASAQDAATKTYVDSYGVPSGVICMWHGLIANIPTGWVLCDGTNSTPDLAEKFVRGAADAAEAGGTGGESTHSLTEAELAVHDHAHGPNSPYVLLRAAGTGYGITTGSWTYENNANTANAGSGTAHENKPPYYDILYIMKT